MSDRLDPSTVIREIEEQQTKVLRAEFAVICRVASVRYGLGPPLAYFDRLREGEDPQRYIYVSYGLAGERKGGAAWEADTPFEVVGASITFFRNWLQPNRTLVWREEPMVEASGSGKWGSHWRCVQLEDDANEITVRWCF